MEITGTLVEKFDAVHVSATFKKRVFVIEQVNVGNDGNDYPELISLELIQDKTDLIDKYNIGDRLEVLFNLKGRKWVSPQNEVKYFNTLQAWQIHSEKDGNSFNKSPEFVDPPAPQQPAPVKKEAIEPPPMPEFNSEAEDDIPF